MPSSRDLPDPEVEPVSLVSPALADGFFTTSATWEAHMRLLLLLLLQLSRFSRVRLFVTLWTVALKAPLSMGFSRQDYWSGLPRPLSEDLPDPGIEPSSLMSPALGGGFFTTSAMTVILDNALSFLPPWLSSLNPWLANSQSR